MAVNVTIEHKGDGCCGQEQVVLCNATRATQVDVLVGDKELMSYIYSKRNITVDEDGFFIRANARKVADFLSDFDIEIIFKTKFQEVSITCDVVLLSVTQNVTANSKFVLQFLHYL